MDRVCGGGGDTKRAITIPISSGCLPIPLLGIILRERVLFGSLEGMRGRKIDGHVSLICLSIYGSAG